MGAGRIDCQWMGRKERRDSSSAGLCGRGRRGHYEGMAGWCYVRSYNVGTVKRCLRRMDEVRMQVKSRQAETYKK